MNMLLSRAIVMTSTGAPDVLHESVVNIPVPAAGQVVLRVLAAGFNPIDTKIRAGIAAVAPDHGVLGCDVCGEVVSVGEAVTYLSTGDRVMGFAGGIRGRWGSYSEYMLADACLLAKAPAQLSDAQCAVLPLVSITAAEALVRLSPETGDELMILGASGAVGRMALQMAIRNGCRVTGTAGSRERCHEIESLGAVGVLHNECAELIAAGKGFPRVLDTFGGVSLQNALALAQSGGQVATINARGSHELGLAHAKALTLHAVFIMIPLLSGKGLDRHQKIMSDLISDLAAGILQPLPVDTVAMSDIAETHRRYESGELSQKVAFVWA
jgi:NADPH:quinone reductase